MATTTLTRNLKLRINSNLTADSKYNLERIDLLGSTFLVDTTDALNIRSKTNILIEPESADVDGSGVGGIINMGTSNHELAQVFIYSTQFNLSDSVGLLDAGLTGTKYLRIGYNSTLNGGVDNAADRALTVDMEGADRQLILGGDFSLLSGNLQLTNQNSSATYTLPAGATGTLATISNAETLTNKVIDADANTLTNIRNNNVASNAGIDYSKLNLALSIVNADVSLSAGIVYSKLSLGNSIINNDINSAAGIAYNKLDLSDSIVDADISAIAAIDYSKLNLVGEVKNADIASGAAILGSKIDPDFGSQIISTTASVQISNGANWTSFQADPSQSGNIPFTLPAAIPAGNQILRANAITPTLLEWASIAGTGTVTSVDMSVPAEFSVSGNPITAAGTLAVTSVAQSANTVWAGPSIGGATTPAFRALVATDLPANTVIGVTDTTSVDLTITGTALSAAVLPGGVNHNALSNYVANEHINHATVSISTSATSGLTGGGDLTGTRSLAVDPDSATLKASPAGADEVLIADSAASFALKKATLSSIITAVGGGSYAEDWTSSTTHTTTHNLGSRDVQVQLYDNTSYETIDVDLVVRTTTNTVDFTASAAPSGAGWRILIKKIS